MAYCLSFLNQDDYQIYNRTLAKHLKSVNAAIMLSELVNRYQYHSNQNELVSHEKHGEGWFYYTIENMEERTCLSRREQESAIQILEAFDLVKKISIGLPAKRHFKINENEILKIEVSHVS